MTKISQQKMTEMSQQKETEISEQWRRSKFEPREQNLAEPILFE